MKKLKIEEAIGYELLHDVTEVDGNKNFKGIAFKKGHKIKEEDIPKFKKIGKMHIFVKEKGDENLIHENEAAKILAPFIAGENIYFDKEPNEGKINFYSHIDGIFQVDKERVIQLNMLKIPSFPTIHNNFPVNKHKLVAAFRIIPLFCHREIIDKAKKIITEPVIKVLPFKIKNAGIIVTGNEVYNGIIEDKFVPLLTKKLNKYNVSVENSVILPDDKTLIKNKIIEFAERIDLILITGGTSVDPDDETKQAMKEAGVKVVQEGIPIQPGNNLTIGYLKDIPVVAIPAAAIYFKTTSFDIFLPQILAGKRINQEDLAELSIGGLCHFCKNCTYPVCPFGK